MKEQAAMLCFAAIGLLAAAPSQARDQRTAGAVIALDEAWGKAESRGDTAFVDDLLLPEYRSIGSDGKVTTKAMIVGHTKGHGSDPSYASKVADWRRTHPSRPEVVVNGDVAVLTWMPTEPDDGIVRSCDVFVYRAGHWHALYSQHTTA